MPNSRVLFVTSELYPLVKTGGLADVSASLPAALRAAGVDIRVLMPGYDAVLDADLDWRVVVPGMRLVPVVWQMAQLLEGQITDTSGESVPIYAIDCPALYHRTGGPYLQSDGSDWPDNDARFALLGAVATYLASPHGPLNWQPNILQLNDWQSSLAAAYCQFSSAADTQVITTVHNLSFAGDYPHSQVSQWGVPETANDINGLEYYGRASFFKSRLVLR